MNFRTTLLAGVIVACGAANAQVVHRQHDVVVAAPAEAGQQVQRREVLVHTVGIASTPAEFVSAEFGVGSKVVKGAPYAAEAVTETVQTLADGNRIAHKSTSAVARDSEGRTRRDISLPAGPWATDAKAAPRISVIFDPVTNSSYTLDHNEKIARKLEGNGVTIHDVQTSGSAERVASGPLPRVAYPAAATAAIATGPTMVRMRHPGAEGATESLGKRTIEGVQAEGTRTVHLIPAGAIGNERPIEIVSERWYSPELQTLVMTRNADPRTGETTYKLTNVRLGEPLKSLFEVPADYTVKTETPPAVHIRTREVKE
jgi:hypothetical protein